MMRLTPPSPQAAREVRRDTPLRRARTCYGHLAGVAGVRLMDELLERGWLETMPVSPEARRVCYALTTDGASALRERDVIIRAVKPGKPVAISCLDWTERRWHLGGALGRAITAVLFRLGCIRLVQRSRVVEATVDLGVFAWLDASAPLR